MDDGNPDEKEMINIEEIAKTIVGLKTYESKINSQKMKLYK